MDRQYEFFIKESSKFFNFISQKFCLILQDYFFKFDSPEDNALPISVIAQIRKRCWPAFMGQ